MPRIGLLTNDRSPHVEAFEQGLRELGYAEGRNLLVERRTAEGRPDRLPALAGELVRAGVRVIVAPDPPSLAAASSATRAIPIVTRFSDDPVERGLVASLAHPGGNITGLYSQVAQLGPKHRAMLKDAFPRTAKVGVRLVSLDVRGGADLDGAFSRAVRERSAAIITLRNPVIVVHRRAIVALAARARLPVIYDEREFVEAGGLMSYGASLDDLHRRAAGHVDRILRGARPADLPIEQPTTFELVINLGAARAMALDLPRRLLLRADHLVP